jgi:hypothetical protein
MTHFLPRKVVVNNFYIILYFTASAPWLKSSSLLVSIKSNITITYYCNKMMDDDLSPQRKELAGKLDVLRYAIENNSKIVKGLKETLKAIETRKAKVVFLAEDTPLDTYKTVIRQYCSIFYHSNLVLLEVKEWMKLRNVAFGFRGKKEELQNPKCYCAAILLPTKEEEKERKTKMEKLQSESNFRKTVNRQSNLALFQKLVTFDTKKGEQDVSP